MSSVPEKELQQNLDSILTRAQSERIVISRRGFAVLVGIEDYDVEDLALASSDDLWRTIRQRRASGNSLPLSEVEGKDWGPAVECRLGSAHQPRNREGVPE